MNNEKYDIFKDSNLTTNPRETYNTYSEDDQLQDHFDDKLIDYGSRKHILARVFSPISQGSLRGSIFSLASICFDTTSLSFPLVLTYVGLVPGTLMLLTISLLSYWSLRMILYSGRKRKILCYRTLIQECLGDKCRFLADINNLIFSVGAQTAYIVTIARFFKESYQFIFGYEPSNMINITQMVLSMVFIQIPLSLIENISSLQFISMVGSFVLVYTLVVMTIESFFYHSQAIENNRQVQLFKPLSTDYLSTFSVFLFGFAPHNGLLLIYSEMSRPTLRRSRKVLDRAMILQTIVFIIIAFAGYFSLIENMPIIFLSRPPLNNFDQSDYLVFVAKFMFFLSLHGLCAINFNLLRGTLRSLFHCGQVTYTKDVIVTCLMFFCSNLLAYFCDNIVTIVGIVSGISVNFICYVFPISCYITTSELSLFHWKNMITLIIMIIVSITGIAATVNGLIDYFDPK